RGALVRIVRTGSGKELAPYRTKDEFASIGSVAYSPVDQRLAAATDSDAVHVWSTGNRKSVDALPESGDIGSPTIAFSPDGDVLADSDGTRVRLRDVATRQKAGPSLPAKAVALGFVADDRLVTVGGDGTVAEWKVGSSEPVATTRKPLSLFGDVAAAI